MAILLHFVTFIAVALSASMPTPTEAAPGSFCVPVLPPSIAECRIGSISVSESRKLENYIKDNITEAQRHLMDIMNVTSCHPDYLSLNEVSDYPYFYSHCILDS
jgi:hypothetical protein